MGRGDDVVARSYRVVSSYLLLTAILPPSLGRKFDFLRGKEKKKKKAVEWYARQALALIYIN